MPRKLDEQLTTYLTDAHSIEARVVEGIIAEEHTAAAAIRRQFESAVEASLEAQEVGG